MAVDARCLRQTMHANPVALVAAANLGQLPGDGASPPVLSVRERVLSRCSGDRCDTAEHPVRSGRSPRALEARAGIRDHRGDRGQTRLLGTWHHAC